MALADHNGLRIALCAVVGAVCLPQPAIAQGVDMGCSPTVANPCGPRPSPPVWVPQHNPAADRHEEIRVKLERVMVEATKHPSPQARLEAYSYASSLCRELLEIENTPHLRDLLSQAETMTTWYSGVVDARNKNYLSARNKLMDAYRARRDLFSKEDSDFIGEVVMLYTSTLPNSTRIYPVPSEPGVAWRQLNCTASIMRRAIAGVMESADYRSLRQMSDEARKAMDGGELSMPCQPAPPLPVAFALPEEREKLKTVQAQIIDKAQLLGARMEQREAGLSEQARKAMKKVQAATPATGMKPETEIERLRRVQLALNRINEVKLDGKSVEAIQAQEKDRVDMGKLLLATEKIEKGNIDLGIDLSGGTSRGQRGSPSP